MDLLGLFVPALSEIRRMMDPSDRVKKYHHKHIDDRHRVEVAALKPREHYSFGFVDWRSVWQSVTE